MKNHRLYWMRPLHVLGCGLTMVTSVAMAQAPVSMPLSDRVDRLEQLVESSGGYSLQGDLNALREEIQQLRGMVEVNQHEVQQLVERQRELYNDLDARITALQGGAPRSTSNAFSKEDAAMVVSDEKSTYDAAYQLLSQQKYSQAVEGFERYVKTYPNGEYAANAYYWLGEAEVIANDLDNAKRAFQVVLDKYPDSPKAPDALLKLGFVYEDAGQYDKALEILNQVIQKYPQSPQARWAEQHKQQINNIAR